MPEPGQLPFGVLPGRDDDGLLARRAREFTPKERLNLADADRARRRDQHWNRAGGSELECETALGPLPPAADSGPHHDEVARDGDGGAEAVAVHGVARGELPALTPVVGSAEVALEHVRRAAVVARAVFPAGSHDHDVTRDRHVAAERIAVFGVARNELLALAPVVGSAEVALEDVRRADFGPTSGTALLSRAMSRTGLCGECHVPDGPPGSLEVAEVTQPMRFFMHGWFDHDAHRQEECTTCHAADKSSTSADLLLPGIGQCRECHEGESSRTAEVPSGCAMCHSYHPRKGAAAAPPRIARR